MRGSHKKNTPEQLEKKQEAHKVYNRALRNNTLVKVVQCENCLEDSNNIHGHHIDYDKPLDVVWLCATCHMKVHCCSQFVDAFDSAIEFKKRTSINLDISSKELLYKKLGLNKFKRIPLKERCTVEERALLEEIEKLSNDYMRLHFKAKDIAGYYIKKAWDLQEELEKKYTNQIEQIY